MIFFDHRVEERLNFLKANFGDIKITKIMEEMGVQYPLSLLIYYSTSKVLTLLGLISIYI